MAKKQAKKTTRKTARGGTSHGIAGDIRVIIELPLQAVSPEDLRRYPERPIKASY